jgi:GrpB-like predicted nucleotidyltransferase (UPF0157 family)
VVSEPDDPSVVLARVPYAEPVVVVAPDPGWAAAFEADRCEIEAVLAGAALAVDHVGSTAVPGLPAKPVIDILLQVTDSADEATYVPALLGLGYRVRVREPAWLEHRVLARRVGAGVAPGHWQHHDPHDPDHHQDHHGHQDHHDYDDHHDVNLHVLSPRHAAGEIDRMIGFRDWLRTHDVDRDRYAALKRELAGRRWRFVQDYADAKSPLVEQILARVAQERR